MMENLNSKKELTNLQEHSTNLNHIGNLCVICADNNPFLVIGPCDHTICSLCSLRLRYKDNDKSCPICKQQMDLVVCYNDQTSGTECRSFESFGIWGDTPLPGTNVDHVTNTVYFDCSEHYLKMRKMR